VSSAVTSAKPGLRGKNGGPVSKQAIHEQILRAILSRSLSPGEKIDPQRLARELGVGQTPLREALSRLVLPGYVVHVPNKGYYVSEVGDSIAEEFYNLRLLLETWCVEHIREDLIAGALPAIEAAAQGFRDAVERNNSLEIFLENSRFHVALSSLCGSQVMLSLLTQIFEFLTLRRIMSAPRYQEGLRRAKEHQTIVRALKRRAVKDVRKHLANHLKGLKPLFVVGKTSRGGPAGGAEWNSGRPILLRVG
jgi:DNA-binding GntR family transcriptional regulator